jgi:hypothetical protein
VSDSGNGRDTSIITDRTCFPGQAFPGFWPFGGNIGPVATSVVGPQTVTSSLSAPAPHVAVSSSCKTTV